MNSIFNYNISFIRPTLFRESAPLLNEQWKKISLIAAAAFVFFAACYYMIKYCSFKTSSLGTELDIEDHNDYAPPVLNHSAPMRKIYIPFILDPTLPSHPTKAPLYEIEIAELKEKLTSAIFCIENYHIDDGVIEFFVDYGSTGDPEIQALWDEENKRLYLVGGKCDPGVKIGPSSFKFADRHKAWVRIDLRTLPEKGDIPIYIRAPAIYAGHDFKKMIDEKDELIITVSNK